MIKLNYLLFLSLIILISLICVSREKNEKRNHQNFLQNLGLPDNQLIEKKEQDVFIEYPSNEKYNTLFRKEVEKNE